MNSTLFRLPLICFVSLAVGSLAAVVAAEKPQEVLDATAKIRKAGAAAAKTGEKPKAASDTRAEIVAWAKKGLEGVDAAKVDLAEVPQWYQVFVEAQDYPGARTLAQRWATEAKGTNRFEGQMTLVREEARAKDYAGVRKALLAAEPSDNAGRIRVAAQANTYAMNVVTNESAEAAFKMLATAAKLVPTENFTDDKQKDLAKRTSDNLAKTRKTMEENPGKEGAALQKERQALLAGLLGRNTNAAASRAERDAKLEKLVGTAATDFKAGQVIGKFNSVGDLKGKVVMLDFFAHWCGPCIASFPSVRELYADLKPKGFEVVGVTRYYGSYKQQKNLSPETELEKMKEFVKEKDMTWPVAFVDNKVFSEYQCSAIPHAVLIDRAGKIHKVKVGFSAAEFPKFRAEVEKLLKE